MKGTLEFDLPEEQVCFERAVKAQQVHEALDAIWDRVFRPAFKHGYGGLHAEVLNAYMKQATENGDVIEALSEIYQEVLREHGL